MQHRRQQQGIEDRLAEDDTGPCLLLLQEARVEGRSFARIDPKVERVFITENEINFRAFPEVADSLIIFGAGYGFETLTASGQEQAIALCQAVPPQHSPHRLHAKGRKRGVAANQRHTFRFALRGQHPVEWVAALGVDCRNPFFNQAVLWSTPCSTGLRAGTLWHLV